MTERYVIRKEASELMDIYRRRLAWDGLSSPRAFDSVTIHQTEIDLREAGEFDLLGDRGLSAEIARQERWRKMRAEGISERDGGPGVVARSAGGAVSLSRSMMPTRR